MEKMTEREQVGMFISALLSMQGRERRITELDDDPAQAGNFEAHLCRLDDDTVFPWTVGESCTDALCGC